VALRYFAGEHPDDILVVHRISFTEVFRSIWKVINAINKCGTLKVSFPTNHIVQKRIEAGFWNKSRARFHCYVGAINGMLFWKKILMN
jgi:hypothetical protein